MREEHTFDSPVGAFNYVDWGGSGPTAHMAHATGFCARVYEPLSKALGEVLRVVGLDDRGHGSTRVPADPSMLDNWDVFAEDLMRFFEYLGEPVVAMGHSRGGTISLMAAVKRPELVRALVLIDPTILPLSWKWVWLLAKKIRVSGRIPISVRAARRKRNWPDRDTLLDTYRRKPSFRNWKPGFLESYVTAGTEDDGHGRVRLRCDPAWESRCFSVCPHDIWPYLSGLRVPTLVVYGADSDTFLAPAARRFAAMVPNAEFCRLENTGHFVPMERPQETVRAILGFLKKNDIV